MPAQVRTQARAQILSAAPAPPPAPTAQQLFTDGALTGLTSAGDDSGYNLGLKFTVAQAGYIKSVKFGKPTGAVQVVRRCGIYSAAGDLLMEGTRGEMQPEPLGGNVVEVSLDEPLAVE